MARVEAHSPGTPRVHTAQALSYFHQVMRIVAPTLQRPNGAFAANVILDAVAGFPNGIKYAADRRRLYVAFTQLGDIRQYDVAGDGSLREAGLVAAAGSPDGLALDTLGNLWVANFAAGRIDVFDMRGDTLGFLDNPAFGASVQNWCFGGPSDSTLHCGRERHIQGAHAGGRAERARGDAGDRGPH